MLKSTIGWCGKLPTQADFIQSSQYLKYESMFMQWMIKGQDHLGEQLVKVNEYRPIYFYFFSINSFDIDKNQNLIGLLFNSRDQRGRSCPFIMFCPTTTTSDIKSIYLSFWDHLKALNFDFASLHPELNEHTVYKKLEVALKCLEPSMWKNISRDYWIEFYPDLSTLQLNVEKTNHIVYRKLMLR